MSDLLKMYDRIGREEDERLFDRRGADLERTTFKQIGGDPLRDAIGRSASSAGAEHGNAEFEFEVACRALPEHLLADAHDAFKRGLSKCESPIERRLFPWLLCQQYNNFDHAPCVLLPGETEKLRPYSVAVVPQLPIGNRRADFALAAKRGGPVRFVIIECDGEKFHADVHKDVQRDSELMRYQRVLDVHPITGKEIWRNAREAAVGASRALTHAWSKTNRMTARKFA